MNYIVAVCGVHRTHRAQRCQPRGLLVQSGIDTRSYAIINVSFASGIDRPLYWQALFISFFLLPVPVYPARGIRPDFILTARDREQRWDFRHFMYICVYMYVLLYYILFIWLTISEQD